MAPRGTDCSRQCGSGRTHIGRRVADIRSLGRGKNLNDQERAGCLPDAAGAGHFVAADNRIEQGKQSDFRQEHLGCRCTRPGEDREMPPRRQPGQRSATPAYSRTE